MENKLTKFEISKQKKNILKQKMRKKQYLICKKS